jgi:hypothetical protein
VILLHCADNLPRAFSGFFISLGPHFFQNREAFMRFDFAFLVSALALSWITDAAADAPRLKGSYGFTGSAVCLVAPGFVGTPNGGPPLSNPTPGVALPNSGFQPNLRPTDALSGTTSSYTYSFSVEGVRTFDGHGNGTVKGTAFSITGRPTPGPGGFPHFPPAAGTAASTVTAPGPAAWSREVTAKRI